MWDEERSASMRYIGRSYLALNNPEQGVFWFSQAIQETPWLREPYLELAFFYYNRQRFAPALFYCEKALLISSNSFDYINEENAWDATPYDLAALCCYHLQMKDKAISFSKKALELAPWDERIQANHQLYLQMQTGNLQEFSVAQEV